MPSPLSRFSPTPTLYTDCPERPLPSSTPSTTMVTKFFPHDSTISKMVKERIERWQENPPSCPFERNALFNTFLFRKFPPSKYLMKPPVACIGELNDGALLREYGTQLDDPLPLDENLAAIVENLRDKVFRGELSVETKYSDFFSAFPPGVGIKTQPSFVVCECPQAGKEDQDRVLLVVETASSPVRATTSETAKDAALSRAKERVRHWLEDYMDMLGEDGVRWRDKVLGVAVVGLEVAILLPYWSAGILVWEWLSEDVDGVPTQWFSLYGKQFSDQIEQVKRR
ncbi:hypothetical protein GSI_04137 [Ganoderma sinense ZZ0214-1]|uniref:Uncharacterized protein n=1 Tax=Ganoderma sinense ZZ0214-1 TaxID=1077348 RepID=A0A2G8SIB7_9APHY|nr:hypothetical protein GSI_04137 [Ganoderma sinense ZZ0214-1]